MDRITAKQKGRLSRKKRVRRNIGGTAARPRLTVYRSLKHIYAQIIDDEAGNTLVAASSMGRDLRDEIKQEELRGAAKAIGVGHRARRLLRATSKKWSSTAMAMPTTARSRRWPRRPEKPGWSSKPLGQSFRRKGF